MSKQQYNQQRTYQKQSFGKIKQFINGVFQGTSLHHKATGPGIMIDDQFNFFLSQWKKGQLNGLTYIHFYKLNMILYGNWKQGFMSGINVIKFQNIMLFVNCNPRLPSRWQSPFIVYHTNNSIIYIVQLMQDKQNYPHIKILNRIINNENNLKAISHFLKLEISEIYLKPETFLQYYTQIHDKITFDVLKEDQKTFYLGFLPQKIESKLGLGMKTNFQNVILSIGMFNKNIQLNGLGKTLTKKYSELMGIFKDGLLVKQFNEQNKDSRTSRNSNHKELLTQEHMKSLNYQHQFIYFPVLNNLKHSVQMISNYTSQFEKQLTKRYPKYKNSVSLDSQPSTKGKKYELSQINQSNLYKFQNSYETLIAQFQFMSGQLTQKKKPGFIYYRQKSPLSHVSKSPTPSKLKFQSPEKRSTLKFSRKNRLSPKRSNFQSTKKYPIDQIKWDI